MSVGAEHMNGDSPHTKEGSAVPTRWTLLGRGLSPFMCVKASA
jgi:hypothetical protein